MLAVAITVSGCSSGSGTTTTATTQPDQGGSGSTTSVAVPPYVASHNAFPDVTRGTCTGSSSAGWTLEGTVRNSSSTTRRYSIAVDFITMPGDTVQGTTVVNVGPVDPHNTAHWKTPATAKGHDHLTCVIRQALWS
jgi:hypothetical protein